LRRKFKRKFKRKFYRLNWNIIAPKLRVINKEGKQIGILTKDEALKLAREQETDLVEIAPGASPPVCKLIDFRKFLYLEKKKEKEQKKGAKGKGIKEIRLRPFIGDHDYQVRLNQAKDFLKQGEKLRVRVRFFGREIAKKKFGFEIINRLLKDLGESVSLEREPRFIGKTLVAQLAPDKNYGKKTKEARQTARQAKSKDKENSSKKVQNNKDRQSTAPRPNDKTLKVQKEKITDSAPKKSKRSSRKI